ncbi:caffeine-induced death protein 2-domain-containing protein [Phakopsora pachyrhizi]|uniref:Caffeine-induced death protein 2-domain-containing protein n=1 Tax=Phakopsora pachyrhizi TaxID=170000 RepID=A0AAV0AT32_PHAPC|nr:caffeine-induced death protein 2-domain-containing protein [Phakopsora pachyrhizi]CAH7670783.1 caffeine-induced death protein 2-domain-containing protein [Phakopsora pachyrhizi]
MDGDDGIDRSLLGTEWIESQLKYYSKTNDQNQTDSTINQSICLNLSEFRKHLQSYRKLDDSISLSLNRSSITFNRSINDRDFDKNCHDDCNRFWKLLTESWLSRERLIRSCIDVVDNSLISKRDSIKKLSTSEPTSSNSQRSELSEIEETESIFRNRDDQNQMTRVPDSNDKQVDSLVNLQRRRHLESEAYTENLKRRMIHDELAVESAIRKQSLEKFKSFCSSSIFKIPDDSPKVEVQPHHPTLTS